MGIRVPADRLLVVTPHCLQLALCPHKITRDPENCKRCGRCDIGALVTLSHEMGFHFFVATGGTLARQIVYKTKPKAVLAIACERDLMSGIQDVYPLPAVVRTDRATTRTSTSRRCGHSSRRSSYRNRKRNNE